MKIIVYTFKGNSHIAHVGAAIHKGLKRYGLNVETRNEFKGVEGDIAVAYGWVHEPAFAAYGRYLFFDMGYWGRGREGNYRLAINDWCPSWKMRRDMPIDRLNRSGKCVESLGQRGKNIIVCGMSKKAAGTHGLVHDQWELGVVEEFRRAGYPVVWRPKGSLPPIDQALDGARALVAYHSNCTVDALFAGVPFHCLSGVGRLMAHPMKGLITASARSYYDRVKFLADVAYCQWTPDEMRSGEVWDYAKDIV